MTGDPKFKTGYKTATVVQNLKSLALAIPGIF